MENKLNTYDAVVVGAGFAGLYMTKRLRDADFSVRTFEAGDGVGGTWHWNRYPGARVDLECWDYSYSFSRELENEWNWSERYPSQTELLQYLNHVADRFNLRPHIQLNTRVMSASFDEQANVWKITTSDGKTTTARFLITAAGVLSTPKPPEIDGLASFRGKCYHTGQWPQEGVDFSGQRVGVIGTGSSGVQVIQSIAPQAAHLTVFQRTAVFVVPCINYPLDDDARAEVRRAYPQRRQQSRESRFGTPAVMPTGSAISASAEERREKYENAWKNSHLLGFRMTYADILTNEEANATVADFIREKIRTVVKKPEVAEKLLPCGFPFGTKRPCLGLDYYGVFNRDNVSLVDLKAAPIERVVPEGIETTEGLHELDSLVFATGFDAISGAILRIDIRGVGGTRLSQKWAHGPKAYLGLGTHGFPNLYTVTGPGSPGPLSNMAVSIEQHVDWIADCLAHLREHGIVRMEAREDAEETWMQHVQDVVEGTLYLKANSWYVGANVPGKPRVFMPYLGGASVYRKKCDDVAASGYQGFALSRSEAAITSDCEPERAKQ